MNQELKNTLPLLLDPSVIQGFIANQPDNIFVRSLEGELESVDYPPDSTVRLWYNDSPRCYDSHWHAAFEMIIPLDGGMLAETSQRSFTLMPGDILVIPGGELHRLEMPPQGSRFIFLFDFDIASRIKGSSYLASCLAGPVLINQSTCPTIYEEQAKILQQLCTDYVAGDGLAEVAIYARLLTFFVNYGKYRRSLERIPSRQQSPQISQRGYTEKFNAVFSYLEQHFAEDLTLEKVADVAGFSKYHFSRIFKQFSGYNFYDYLRRRRIKAAEQLLMKPRLSISEIALQSGFSSVSTFNRTFKESKGCTPTEYRGMFQAHVG